MRRASLFLPCLIAAACGPKPEEKSGTDAYRHTATPLAMEAWAQDDVSFNDGDRTDWWFFDLDAPTELTITLALEDSGSVTLGAYDTYGKKLGQAFSSDARADRITLRVQAPKGEGFVRVAATGPFAAASYSLQVSRGQASFLPPRPE